MQLQKRLETWNPNRPTPHAHDKFAEQVTEELDAQGFLCHSAEYHKILPPQMWSLLRQRYSPNALYLRGRADRIAIHRTFPIEFEWEAKTHDSRIYDDLTIELPPLCMHLAKARHEIECLYVYRERDGRERGFWVSSIGTLVPARVVLIPARWEDVHALWFEALARQYLPRVTVHRMAGHTKGSGDPLVIIDKTEVAKMRDWRDLVRARINPIEYGARGPGSKNERA